jgi:hypothetical protein
VGFVVDKLPLGEVLSEYFGFSCQFSFYRLLHTHHHILSSGAGAIDQIVVDMASGTVSPHPEKILLVIYLQIYL